MFFRDDHGEVRVFSIHLGDEEDYQQPLKQFLMDSQPVIIRGLSKFDHVMGWSIDNLIEKGSNINFKVSCRDENKHVIGAESYEQLTLPQFIEKSKHLHGTMVRYYLSGSELLEDIQNGKVQDDGNGLNQLQKDCNEFKEFVEKNLSGEQGVSSFGFWIGLDGQKTHLHFDCVNNLMLQIRGRKTFLLASPHDHLKLQLHSFKTCLGQEMNGEIYRFSQCNIFDECAVKETFPRLKKFNF